MILEVVVILRPTPYVGSAARRTTEAPQVIGMGLDPSKSETRRDVRMAPGVFGDPVDEEGVRARRSGRAPAQRAQLKVVSRSGGPDEGVCGNCHGTTIRASGLLAAVL